MKLPDKVKVLHRTYSILPYTELDILRDSAWGNVDYMRGEIRIIEAPQASETIDTLIHEILHCVVRAMDVDFKDKQEEEDAVIKISTGLVTVLKDNPDVLKYVYKQLQK